MGLRFHGAIILHSEDGVKREVQLFDRFVSVRGFGVAPLFRYEHHTPFHYIVNTFIIKKSVKNRDISCLQVIDSKGYLFAGTRKSLILRWFIFRKFKT
jgi:hypothetical protein